MSTIVTRAGKGSALTWTEGDANFTNLNTDKLENIVADTTPQLGGNLDVNGNSIVSVSNGNITIAPNGTGDVYLTADLVRVGDHNSDVTISSYGTGNLTLNTHTGTNSGIIRINQGNNGNIEITPDGTGAVVIDGLSYPQADGTANQVLKTNGSGVLSFVTPAAAFDPASPGAIGATTAAAGTFTALTASTSALLKGITEGALYDIGTAGGTQAPNVANGNVQKITLNSALTINAFTSPVAGQSLTLIIFGGTAYTSITSTMKFAGGVKTLTGTASCIDILSVYYDGTNYYASLGKGFA
jgi:hypothetical protein